MSNSECPIPIIYDYLQSYVAYRKLVKTNKNAELVNMSDDIELVIPVFGARKGKKHFYDGAKNFKPEDEVTWDNTVGWFDAEANVPVRKEDNFKKLARGAINDGIYKRYGKIYKMWAWRNVAEYWTVTRNLVSRLEVKVEAAPNKADLEKAKLAALKLKNVVPRTSRKAVSRVNVRASVLDAEKWKQVEGLVRESECPIQHSHSDGSALRKNIVDDECQSDDEVATKQSKKENNIGERVSKRAANIVQKTITPKKEIDNNLRRDARLDTRTTSIAHISPRMQAMADFVQLQERMEIEKYHSLEQVKEGDESTTSPNSPERDDGNYDGDSSKRSSSEYSPVLTYHRPAALKNLRGTEDDFRSYGTIGSADARSFGTAVGSADVVFDNRRNKSSTSNKGHRAKIENANLDLITKSKQQLIDTRKMGFGIEMNQNLVKQEISISLFFFFCYIMITFYYYGTEHFAYFFFPVFFAVEGCRIIIKSVFLYDEEFHRSKAVKSITRRYLKPGRSRGIDSNEDDHETVIEVEKEADHFCASRPLRMANRRLLEHIG